MGETDAVGSVAVGVNCDWSLPTNGNGNAKCRFVERINARNLSTAATPLMRYVSQLRRKHTSLYAVLRLSIFKTMNPCNGK